MSNTAKLKWSGLQVWDRHSFESEHEWALQLSDQEISELHYAIQSSVASLKPIGELKQNDFSLPTLAQRLTRIKEQLLRGRGFVLVKGLPATWSDEELVRAYWGLGLLLGQPVSQNAKAHLLGHVIDQRATDSAGTRIYQTNRAQPFHSDSCDIVGLLCLRAAKDGGASSVASSAAIHNHLLDTNPKALDTLYGEFKCDRYGEIPQGKMPYYTVRVFNNIDDQLVCCGMDPDIRSAQKLKGVGALTDGQLSALDAFQESAKKLCLNMQLHRGDMQFVNNLVAVHARESFSDHAELEKRRYLIRLWLSSNEGRRLPAFLSERWGNIDVGSVRGGIKVPGAVPIAHLNPND